MHKSSKSTCLDQSRFYLFIFLFAGGLQFIVAFSIIAQAQAKLCIQKKILFHAITVRIVGFWYDYWFVKIKDQDWVSQIAYLTKKTLKSLSLSTRISFTGVDLNIGLKIYIWLPNAF